MSNEADVQFDTGAVQAKRVSVTAMKVDVTDGSPSSWHDKLLPS